MRLLRRAGPRCGFILDKLTVSLRLWSGNPLQRPLYHLSEAPQGGGTGLPAIKSYRDHPKDRLSHTDRKTILSEMNNASREVPGVDEASTARLRWFDRALLVNLLVNLVRGGRSNRTFHLQNQSLEKMLRPILQPTHCSLRVDAAPSSL